MNLLDREGWVSEVATTNDSALAFINTLGLMAYPYIYDVSETPRGLSENMKNAIPFVKECKLSTVWTRMLKYVPGDDSDYFAIDQFIDAVYDLSVALRTSSRYDTNVSLTSNDVRFIKAFQIFWRTESESSMAQIQKLVGTVASPDVAGFYVEDTSDAGKQQKALLSQVHHLTNKMIGEPVDSLSIEQAKDCRENDPDNYKKYLAVRRDLVKLTKATITNIVRRDGIQSADDLTRDLDKMGVMHSIPDGFIGKMDEKNYFTIYGEQIDGTPVGEVMMNPAYKKGSSNYVLKCKAPGAKGWQNIYTVSARRAGSEVKFKKVADTIPVLEKAASVWRRDLMSNDPERIEMGVILEILYLCQARIGTEGNETDGQATYGLSTILGKHVKVAANRVTITYPGKKGVQQKHIITGESKYSKRVVWYFKELMQSVGAKDRVFNVTARNVNQYIRTKLKLDISAHKFRTLRGTILMHQLLEQKDFSGKQTTTKQVVDYFNECALEVGKELGHANQSADGGVKITGATAIKNYISPEVMAAYFQKWEVRPPASVEAVLVKAGLMG